MASRSAPRSPAVDFRQRTHPVKTATIYLPQSLAAAGSKDFESTFKNELARLGPGALPLHLVMAQGNHVLDEGIEVMVLKVSQTAEKIHVKAGIHFRTIITGCACEDDPTPISAIDEYSEALVSIDRRTGEATIEFMQD